MPRPVYPVSIPIPSKLYKRLGHATVTELRKTLEDHLNEQAKDSQEMVFFYFAIASDTGIDKKIVEEFLYPLSGSSGGITIYNPNVKGQ